MDESSRGTDAANERSLDPDESWGQGADASHPESTDPVANDVGTDPNLAHPRDDDADVADDPPLT